MYDYFLGGHHNVAVDRRAAERALAHNPDIPLLMRTNRAFLRRAVTFLIAQGIDQFLDLGSGIPTVGNVHEVAQRLNPAARVVYVDRDPIAVAHSRTLLQGLPNATVIQADVRQVPQILSHPETHRLLDLGRPLGVLLVALLHFVPADQDAEQLVQAVRTAIAPGSYLVISHGTLEELSDVRIARAEAIYTPTATPLRLRPRAQIEAFFAGFELVAPGVVYVPGWRPDDPDEVFLAEPERSLILGGVARKP